MGDLRAAQVVGSGGRGGAPTGRPNDLNSTTKITHSIFFYLSVSTFTSASACARVSRKNLVFPVNQADYDLYHRVHLVRMALGNHNEGGVGDAL